MAANETLRGAELRLARYYAHKLHHISEVYRNGGAALSAALSAYDQESAQIKQWQSRVVAQGGDHADCDQLIVEFAANMVGNRQNLSEKIARLEHGLAAARRLVDDSAEASLLTELSYITLDKGDVPAARAYAEQAVSAAQKVKNRQLEARAAIRMGQITSEAGDLSAAKEYMQRALVLAELDNKDKLTIYNELGIIAAIEGDVEKSITHFENNIRLCRASGNLTGLTVALNNRAILYRQSGNAREGMALIEESVAINRSLGEKSTLLPNLQLSTEYYMVLGTLTEAQTYADEHLALAQEIGSSREMVSAYISLSEIDLLRGDYESANANLLVKADMIPDLGIARTTIGYTMARARLLVRLGSYTEAQDLCLKTLNDENSTLEPHYKDTLHSLLAETALAAGELEQAISHFRQAASFADNQVIGQVELHSALAEVYLRQDDFAQAQTEITAAAQIAEEHPDEPGMYIRVAAGIAQLKLYVRSGKIEEARHTLCDVLNQVRDLEVLTPRLDALECTADFFAAVGDPRCVRLLDFVAQHPGATYAQRGSIKTRQIALSDQFDSVKISDEQAASNTLELNRVLGELAKEFEAVLPPR